MPVSLEQWRAAVGAWNRRLPQPSRRNRRKIAKLCDTFAGLGFGRRIDQTQTWRTYEYCGGLLLLFLSFLCFWESGPPIARFLSAGINCTLSGPGRISCGGSDPLPGPLAFRWDYISIVARILLIISGDVEINPGPSKRITIYLAI